MDSSELFLILFFSLGIPILFLISLRKINPGISKYAVQSKGKILDRKPYGKLSSGYYVLLEYEYGGVTYSEYSKTAVGPGPWNSNLEIGSTCRIYINPDDPTDVYCGKHIYVMGLGKKQ